MSFLLIQRSKMVKRNGWHKQSSTGFKSHSILNLAPFHLDTKALSSVMSYFTARPDIGSP